MERNKLRGKIVEKFGTQDKFAEAAKITPGTLSQKLNGKSDFTRLEILKWCELLEIPTQDISDYFFAN